MDFNEIIQVTNFGSLFYAEKCSLLGLPHTHTAQHDAHGYPTHALFGRKRSDGLGEGGQGTKISQSANQSGPTEFITHVYA